MAQKNGTVVAHVQIGEPGSLDVVRILLGEADVMLAADLAVGAGPGVLERCSPRAAVIGNLDLAATAEFDASAWLHAVAIAALPDMIRGFGPVKEANRAKAVARRETLLTELRTVPETLSVAAE